MITIALCANHDIYDLRLAARLPRLFHFPIVSHGHAGLIMQD